MSSYSIHKFELNLEALRKRILISNISKGNKELILGFEKYCVAQGLSVARRFKLMQHIYTFATRYFKGTFRKANTKRILDAIFEIESSNLALWTKHDYKVAVKKFIKYVEWGTGGLLRKDYPASVAGIDARIKKKDQVKIQAADLITVDEVERMLAAGGDAQKTAIFSLLYELGARADEIGSMKVGSVSRDEYSFICDLNGKTGPRSVRVVFSAGALTAWLNLHPLKDDPDARLWGIMRKKGWTGVSYGYIRSIPKKLALKANITKRVYPHILRHSRITHLLSDGDLNEAQTKKYFGLVADSAMLGTYSHLVTKNANDAVLKMYGINKKESKKRFQPNKCGMCGEFNKTDNNYCARCGYCLSQKTANSDAARMEEAGSRVSRFFERPGIEDEFRKMVREEIRGLLYETHPQRFSQLSKPSQVKKPFRREDNSA